MKPKTEQMINNSLTELVAGVGVSNLLTGGSDLASYGTIAFNNNYSLITLNRIVLTYLYTSSGIFQTAIDLPTQDALSRGIEIESDQMSPTDIDELMDFMEESGQFTALLNAWNWGRLYGGAGLIINTNQDPQEPLNLRTLKNSPLEFYDADRWQFDNAHPYAGDMEEMLFGMPNDHFYLYGSKIHRSRILQIKGKRAPYYVRRQLRGWGMSEGERMIKDLNLYLKTQNVLYEILDESKIDVYKINGLAQKLINEAGTSAITRRIQLANELKNYVNALIMDAKDEYESKTQSFAGLAEVGKENRIGICSALRMPQTKLFGLSASGFNTGESDLENYNMMIESETRTPMKQIIREMIKLNMYHLWGREAPFRFKFPPLRILSSEQEEAAKSAQQERVLALYDRGLINSQEVGEALQSHGVITIDTAMSKGLLPDQPDPPEQPIEKQSLTMQNSKVKLIRKNTKSKKYTLNSEFKEEDHPRDDGGQFSKTGKGSGEDIKETEEFKKWFSGSKAVNDKGEPLKLYHGSDQKHDIIEPGIGDPGAWFTSRAMTAGQYAKGHEGYLHEAYLSAKDPLVVEMEVNEKTGELEPFVNGKKIDYDNNVSIVQYAEKKGYDSVNFPYGNFTEDDNTWVVFDSDQIKQIED